MRVYVAGPMSGYPEHNFPLFDKVTNWLRALNPDDWTVISPAELTRQDEVMTGVPAGKQDWRYYMELDIRELLLCDGIVMLPGWRASRGATLEYQVACGLGLAIDEYIGEDGDETAHLRWAGEGVFEELPEAPQKIEAPEVESILAEADRLVSTDRQAAYGHPLDNFDMIARRWQTHLDNNADNNVRPVDLTAEDVAIMMMDLKMARLESGQVDHRDSQVDIAGYAKCFHLIREERKRRA